MLIIHTHAHTQICDWMQRMCWSVTSTWNLTMCKQPMAKLNHEKKWQQYFQKRFNILEREHKFRKLEIRYVRIFFSQIGFYYFSSLFRKMGLNECYLIWKHIPMSIHFKKPFLLINSANFLCPSPSWGIHFLEHFYALYKPEIVLTQIGLYCL